MGALWLLGFGFGGSISPMGIMLAEILIGRHTELSPVGAMRQLGSTVRGSKLWTAVGWLSIIRRRSVPAMLPVEAATGGVVQARATAMRDSLNILEK